MTTKRQVRMFMVISLFLVITCSTSTAQADVVSVGPSAFGGSSTLITFTGLSNSPPTIEVNGLNFGGVVFTYSLGNGHLVIGGGPFLSNNVSQPNIESIGDPSGILTIQLSGLVDTFGYGYALNTLTPVANATTITLFNGLTNVGTLSYDAVPDIHFAGGFAGIFSTVAFDRVELTFNSAAAPNFAVDNIRTATTVPEPSTMLLLVTGMAGIAAKCGQKQRRVQSERNGVLRQ